jgi:hypothetical protein
LLKRWRNTIQYFTFTMRIANFLEAFNFRRTSGFY